VVAASGAGLDEPDRTERSILVVDDIEANRIALEAVLEPLGHRVVHASSGRDALKCVLAEDFALILLDVMMPGMDGFETASLIRQRERSRKIPIMFVSAISREQTDQLKGYAHGAVDYIVKPFNPDIVRAKVAVLVELFQP
jgi:CheY-like chemotaxis protein